MVVFLMGATLALPSMLEAQTYRLVLTQLVGSDRYTANELAEGLGLTSNGLVTATQLQEACQRLKALNLFQSASCSHHTSADTITFTMSVEEKLGCCLPVICDNCVWVTHGQLMKRLKEEIPFFSSELPTYSPMNDEIMRVLKQVLLEHNILADVVYSDFWTRRGWNAFHVMGVSTPVREVRFVGATSPSQEELEEMGHGLVGQEFSATFLRWYIRRAFETLYHSRGYLDAEVVDPTFEYLGRSNGTHPVRVILPVQEGNQYCFNSFTLLGLPAQSRQELLPKWRLTQGQPYSELYVERFVFDDLVPVVQRAGLKDAVVETCVTRHQGDHTVDVVMKVFTGKQSFTYGPSDNRVCSLRSVLTFPSPSR
ncbi:MAG: hypothetical protein ACRD4U_01175 [Candidatus Acidiferrales bacterium]